MYVSAHHKGGLLSVLGGRIVTSDPLPFCPVGSQKFAFVSRTLVSNHQKKPNHETPVRFIVNLYIHTWLWLVLANYNAVLRLSMLMLVYCDACSTVFFCSNK